MTEFPMTALHDNTDGRRFEWREGDHVAFADYRLEGQRLVIPYVESPIPLRGTGAAGRLLEALAAHARAHKLKILPLCGYAAAWFRRHPQYNDVLAP
jgi:predicted GNAT family acetyltransferase